MISRRTAIGGSAMALAMAPQAAGLAKLWNGPKRKILVLGGTNFVGPAIVEQALLQGHEVTLFNRGITRPHLFPTLEKLRGDRSADHADLASLGGNRRWDIVIDVWPEQSAMVRDIVDLLSERTDYYYFISSIAVYSNFSQPGITEKSPIHTGASGWYGAEKVLAESMLQERMPGRHGIARCHAITGPRDDGLSYHYWLRRLASHDLVMAPGSGQDPVQFVDVRDVARWVLDCGEQKRTGIYNLTGPTNPITMKSLLTRSKKAIASNAELVWVDADFLRDTSKLRSFSDIPFWTPLDEDEGFAQISSAKALAQGMTFRPVEQTAEATWHWYRSYQFRSTRFPMNGWGISRETELSILKAWAERAGTG